MAINFIAPTPAQTITSGPVTPDIATQLAQAQALQELGSSTAPIYNAGGWGPAAGLARIAAGVFGGMQRKQATQQQLDQQKSIAASLADAATTGQGTKPWIAPDTFQGNNGTVQGGTVVPGTSPRSAMASILARNPLTAGMGANLAVDDASHNQDMAEDVANQQRQFAQQTGLATQSQGAAAALAKQAQDAEDRRLHETLNKPVAVAPGATMFDPTTHQPLFTAPQKFSSPDAMAAQMFLSEHPDATPEELQTFIAKGKSARSPLAMAMQKFVTENPDATASDMAVFNANAQAKAAAAKSTVGGGYDAKFIDSINAASGHIAALKEAGLALQNGDFPAFNRVANAWATATGNAAPGNLDALRNIVGGELVKAIVGAGGGEGDRLAAKAALDGARSPDQIIGATNTILGAMHTQVEARRLKFQQTGQGDILPRFTPQARSALGYDDAGSAGGAAPGPASGSPAATIPKFASPADPAFQALPKGSQFYDGQGNLRVK